MDKCPLCNQKVKVIMSSSGSEILVDSSTTKYYLWIIDKKMGRDRYKITYGFRSHSEVCLMKGKKNAYTLNMPKYIPA